MPIIAVFGGNDGLSAAELTAARLLGAAVVASGATLLTGGDGREAPTVKDTAIAGARQVARTPVSWIGVANRAEAAPPREYGLGIVVTPGRGHKRNLVEPCLCDAAIALSGGPGTASEVVFSVYLARPVVLVGRFEPGEVTALADLARECIPDPASEADPVDAAITAAYAWAAAPTRSPGHAALPSDASAARDIVDALLARIAAPLPMPELVDLGERHSWDEFVRMRTVTG